MRSEGRAGHVSPPQGRGETEDASQPGRVGFAPLRVGPLFEIEHLYDRRPDARRRSRRRGTAYDRETRVLALTIDDREAILRALDDPPDELAEFRGVLLREHEWRLRERGSRKEALAQSSVWGVVEWRRRADISARMAVYLLHDPTGADLGTLNHPAANLEPGDLVSLPSGDQAVVKARTDAGRGPEAFVATLEVTLSPGWSARWLPIRYA